MKVLGHLRDQSTRDLLLQIVEAPERDLALRQAATAAVGSQIPAQRVLLGLAKEGRLPEDLKFTVANLLLASFDDNVRTEAARYMTLPETLDGATLKPLSELVRLAGKVTRGKTVFNTTGSCAKCHRVGDEGRELGPNLNDIGSKLSKEALFVSILDPSAGISHGFEMYSVQLENGDVLQGLLVNETGEAVTIRNVEAIERTVSREEIEDITKQKTSMMPAGVEKLITQQQLVDLVEYLSSLKRN